MKCSVMTFRVKFAAKPGKQFIVKREAFRRITQELEKKGIRFAHRKVIVEMPEPSPATEAAGSAARARAGAAAAQQTILDREAAASKAAGAPAKE